MKSIELLTKSPEETIAWASRLARKLTPGDVLCLFGELGSGKTTFTKGIAKGLNIKSEEVNSPTFILMNVYQGRLPLYHFDFYRLEGEDKITALGYEEFFYGKGVAIVEWADRLGPLLPKDFVKIELTHAKDDHRKIRITPFGKGIELFRKVA